MTVPKCIGEYNETIHPCASCDCVEVAVVIDLNIDKEKEDRLSTEGWKLVKLSVKEALNWYSAGAKVQMALTEDPKILLHLEDCCKGRHEEINTDYENDEQGKVLGWTVRCRRCHVPLGDVIT